MIGEGINRIDGRLKVTGGATYTAEWPIDNLAYGVIVQSSIACGAMTSIDVTGATEQPGVIAVMTADNAPKLPRHGRAGVNPPAGRVLSLLQDHEVRYNGEPVALVIAETFEQATYAVARVHVEYREDLPAVDMQHELPHAEPVTEKILGQFEPESRRGDVNAALRQADVIVEATYATPLETHNPMETHGTIARWDGDRLTLYDATQYLYGVKRFAAGRSA
jgi:xanthine dehydrogenase YagR molybdenum-binding subunit